MQDTMINEILCDDFVNKKKMFRNTVEKGDADYVSIILMDSEFDPTTNENGEEYDALLVAVNK